MIRKGDVVEAIRDGGVDRNYLPEIIPEKSKLYRVTSVYDAKYGLGCTLKGLDPRPYKGYLLFVLPGIKFAEPGWYFRKVDAEIDFVNLMNVIKRRIENAARD